MRLQPGQLTLFDCVAEESPGSCRHEADTYKLKSKCMLTGRPVWTNCRERGHCTLGAAQTYECDSEEDEDEQGVHVR